MGEGELDEHLRRVREPEPHDGRFTETVMERLRGQRDQATRWPGLRELDGLLRSRLFSWFPRRRRNHGAEVRMRRL